MWEQSNRKRRLGSIKKAVSKGVDSTRTAASDKARSARDATVQGARTVADCRAAQGISSAGVSVARRANDVAAQGHRGNRSWQGCVSRCFHSRRSAICARNQGLNSLRSASLTSPISHSEVVSRIVSVLDVKP